MIYVKLYEWMLNAHGGDTQLVGPTSSVQLERKSSGEAEESERGDASFTTRTQRPLTDFDMLHLNAS